MSILACISLGFAVIIVILSYLTNPDLKIVLTMLPMLVVLAGIPLLMNFLNRRHVDKLDLRHVKLNTIKNIVKKDIGDHVRIRGTVQSVSHNWLNRPHFQIADETGEIGVYMFVAPREDINRGDLVETVGSLRWSFGLRKKEKKIWGLQMLKVMSPDSH